MGVGNLLQFENLGAAETSDDECFHAVSLTGREERASRSRGRAGAPGSPPARRGWFAKFGFGIYNEDRVSDPRGLGNSGGGDEDRSGLAVRSEGSDGNVRASRVGKETLVGVTPAGLFSFVEIEHLAIGT